MWGAVVALVALTAPLQPDVTLTGRVVRIVGKDTLGVAGARVVLHRVMTARQGPVDSLLSRTDGSFSFRFHPDSGAIYLASARWSGIEYFAAPAVLTTPPAVPDPMLLLVADTSSQARVGLVARHVIVSAPAVDGTRAVYDLMVLENRGPLTRVASDSLTPVWELRLPAEGMRFETGNSDFASDALEIRDGTLRVNAALPPGQREVAIVYQLPAGVRRWAIPVPDSITTLNVLAEEPTATLQGPLAAADSQVVSGKRFTRWKGPALPGAEIELSFDATGTPTWILPAMVATLAVSLLAAMLIGRSRRASPVAVAAATTAAPLPAEAERLLARLVELDREFADGAAAHDPARWHQYLEQRATLKQELTRHLPA